MGNSNSNHINEQGNVQSQWKMKQKTEYMNIWCRKDNPCVQLQQYQFYINDEKQFTKEKGLYYLRKGHPQLVATYYFTQHHEKDFCASNFKGTVFIQRIPLRLANVTDIPFPDILHLYQQGFIGLQLLSRKFGYFEVNQDKFCINNYGIAKIWLNQQLERCYPPKKINDQWMMVKSILKTIQMSTDLDTMPRQQPSIMKFIYLNKNQQDVDFAYAQMKFREYVQKYNRGLLPQKLNCFQKVGGPAQVAKQIQIPKNNNLINNNNYINHQSLTDQNQIPTLNSIHINENINRKSRINQISFNNQISKSQMLKIRSVSPPLLRGNRIIINSPGAPQNLKGSGIVMNSSGIQNNQLVRLRSQPHQSTQQAFYRQSGVRVSNTNVNLQLNQSIPLISNQVYLNRVSKNSQIKFNSQLQPRQVLVMEPIKSSSKKVIQNRTVQIKNLKKSSQLPVIQQSPQQYSQYSAQNSVPLVIQASPQRSFANTSNNQIFSHQSSAQQNLDSSDIFAARQVQASNILRNSPSPLKQQSQAFSSNIGKQKPIYQSNFISQNQPIFRIQNQNQLISRTSQQSNDQVEWKDYTQQYSQKNIGINKKGFSKQIGNKIYEGQVLNSNVRSSSAQLLDQLNKMKHRANQQISRSRHQAQKDAFNMIKNHPDQIRQIHNFNKDPNQFAYDNTLYTSFNPMHNKQEFQSQYVESSKKKQVLNGDLSGYKINFPSGRVASSQYQTSVSVSPSKFEGNNEGYHVQYDSELLADLNSMKY